MNDTRGWIFMTVSASLAAITVFNPSFIDAFIASLFVYFSVFLGIVGVVNFVGAINAENVERIFKHLESKQ